MKCLVINHYYSLNFLPILTVLLRKAPKVTKLFEFILDILSEPRYSTVISWEGTNGQFVIKRPDQVASLWGERNGRINMTYQKFSRALRYYYHKKVITKIPGRNCVYKFNFPELEKQYGFHSSVLFPATTEPSGYRNSCEIPATWANHIQNPNAEYHFPATREFVDYDSHEIPASFYYLQHPNTANAIVALRKAVFRTFPCCDPHDSTWKPKLATLTLLCKSTLFSLLLNVFKPTSEVFYLWKM